MSAVDDRIAELARDWAIQVAPSEAERQTYADNFARGLRSVCLLAAAPVVPDAGEDAKLVDLLRTFADAQDHMAADSKEDREHWHHVALRDAMRQAALALAARPERDAVIEALRAAVFEHDAVLANSRYGADISADRVVAAVRLALKYHPAPPAQDERNGWLPIETAPRDGSSVIVAVPRNPTPLHPDPFIIGEAYFDHDADNESDRTWWWAGTSLGEYVDSPIVEGNYGPPTYWQPLPAMPVLPPVKAE